MFKRTKKAPKEFQKFSFRPILGIAPTYYVPAMYLILLIVAFYFLFLDQGLRKPQVKLRFYILSGPATLYVDGRLQGNLNYSKDWNSSTVVIPAGQHSLRVERDGLQPWELEQNFAAKFWNNYWKPQTYEFEIRQTMLAQNTWQDAWQEAWRSYLLRGLEARKSQSFDASHPYPWVLSEGLRSTIYSISPKEDQANMVSPHWSADVQRGLAATSSIYQWGDFLTATSLIAQSRTAKHVSLLGPKALAFLLRSGIKRLHRLQPYAQSLQEGLGKERPELAEYLQNFRTKETKVTQAPIGPPRTAFEYQGHRFMAVNDFAVARDEVSNEQFARFWFSRQNRQNRQDRQNNGQKPSSALMQDLLGAENRTNAPNPPWDWPAGDLLTDDETVALIAESGLLRDFPVRGITWQEAQEFCAWFQEQLPESLQSQWQIQLPSTAQRLELARILQAKGEEPKEKELDFQIGTQAPQLSSWPEDGLGLRGMSGSLWEWLQDDFLPYPYEASANGYSDLQYKALAGGSWLNTLPIDEKYRDLWVDEFLQQNQELPVTANIASIGGTFAELRNPFTGFRMVAVRKKVSEL